MRIGHDTHSTIAPSMPTDGCLPDANSQSRRRDVVATCRCCFAGVPARVAGIFFDHYIFMEKLLQDLRFSLRSLVRQPAFALTVILTLALGIGATTAIFSVVNALLLKPLPFEESERIVSIQNLSARTGLPFPNVSAPDFHDWEAQSQSFEAMGYYTGGESSVTVNNRADYAMALRITPGFLPVLRAKAAFGRLLTAEEQRPGGPLAVVLTHAYWLRQFDGHESALGSTIKLDDQVFTVVGVLEPGTRYPPRADFYYPVMGLGRKRTERA